MELDESYISYKARCLQKPAPVQMESELNQPAICLLGDWNVLTKPVHVNQQKLVKIEEEYTISQLLKLWAKVKIPNFCK